MVIHEMMIPRMFLLPAPASPRRPFGAGLKKKTKNNKTNKNKKLNSEFGSQQMITTTTTTL